MTDLPEALPLERRPRLLVVDSGEVVAFVLREFFRGRGFDVVCASSVDQARDLIATRDFAAAIMDCNLSPERPDDGLAILCATSRKRPRPCCFVLTANATPELERVALGLGALAVFQKPARLQLIAHALDRALDLPLAGAIG